VIEKSRIKSKLKLRPLQHIVQPRLNIKKAIQFVCIAL
jgi:hypothetical protein